VSVCEAPLILKVDEVEWLGPRFGLRSTNARVGKASSQGLRDCRDRKQQHIRVVQCNTHFLQKELINDAPMLQCCVIIIGSVALCWILTAFFQFLDPVNSR
jgi:hypothetical protein